MTTKADIELQFATNRDEIEATFREEVAKLEEEKRYLLEDNRKRRDNAFADAGLDGAGNDLPVEREKPEYFKRHRVTEQIEGDKPVEENEQSEDSSSETPDETPSEAQKNQDEPTPDPDPSSSDDSTPAESGSDDSDSQDSQNS